MTIELRNPRLIAASLFLTSLLPAPLAVAATPSAEQALKLTPIQKDVDYDKAAAEVAKCTVKAEKIGGKTGWVVRDGAGQVMRNFVDTNADNVVDQWCYFLEGVEVYRDIDSNFNGKADQARWLNTAGTRWGLDQNEDGKIDLWKIISAEEVSAEAVAALRDRDPARFERLLMTTKELQGLGVGSVKEGELAKKVKAAGDAFRSMANKQQMVTSETKWLHFGGMHPGLVPAGTDGSTSDLMIYDDVAAVIQNKDQTGELAIGTLVRVGDAWRMVDAPNIDGKPRDRFTELPRDNRVTADRPSEKATEVMARVEKIDAEILKAAPEKQSALNAERADLLEELAKIANTPAERVQWQKQIADTVSAAVQSGGYPAGVDRLKRLHSDLQQNEADAEMAAYVEFRLMTAEYTVSLQKTDADYPTIQKKWLEDLEKFVAKYPKSSDSADAMLQLAIALEFSGEDQKALAHYDQVVKQFSETSAAKKALGSKTRLESVGKSMMLRGKSLGGATVDLASLKGKVVLIQYWASWAEPCKADLPQLKDMLDKYGAKGFTILGVSLDSSREDLQACLTTDRVKWTQIFEEGGLDSRLANEMGILTVPTMILVDKNGRVVNRSIHAAELDRELRTLLK